MIFIGNKNNITMEIEPLRKLSWCSPSIRYCLLLGRILREKNPDNVNESEANEDVKETLKRLYLSIS